MDGAGRGGRGDERSVAMLAEFTIVPHAGGEHLSQAVAEMLRIVDGSGLPYEFHSMGTIVEGSWDEVMPLIALCHARMLEVSPRVGTTIRIDDFAGRTGRLRGKVESVEQKLGRKLGRP
jgi:uncharacterized protein (TIGR00106 family)